MKLDVAVLTETKKKEKRMELRSDYIHLYSGVPKSSRTTEGVSLFIHQKVDYIIIKQDTQWKVHAITKVYRGIENGTDHYLLIVKIKIKFNANQDGVNTSLTEVEIEQINITLMDSMNQFQHRLDQKLNTEYMTREPPVYINILRNHYTQQHMNPFQRKQKFWDEEHQHNPEYRIEYQRNKKQQAYKRWLNIKDINDLNLYRQEQTTYKRIINKN